MKSNIGEKDRLFRLAIAIVLLIGASFFSSWILLAFSLFVFYETAFSWCLFYQLTGKNTCPISREKK